MNNNNDNNNTNIEFQTDRVVSDGCYVKYIKIDRQR